MVIMKILFILYPQRCYKRRIKFDIINLILIMTLSSLFLSCGKIEVREPDAYGDVAGLINMPRTVQEGGIIQDHGNFVTPTRLVPPSKIPVGFVDDLNFANMDMAINRQLEYFQKRELSGTIRFGNHLYPRHVLPIALRRFQRLYYAYHNCLRQAYNMPSDTCVYAFHNSFLDHFHVYEPDVNPVNRNNPTLFTGYYTPTLLGSMRRTSRFRYAVYNQPKERHLRTLTRYEIHFQNRLAGRGYELFYTDNLFHIYNMQIQGSGIVQFVDGHRGSYLTNNGYNGIDWTDNFIGRYMKRRGMIRSNTMEAQEAYLNANPHRQAEVYRQSSTYTFFAFSDKAPGSIGVAVTEGRSIATDDAHYVQKGVLAFVQAERPHYGTWERTGQVQMQKFTRFVLDQDTGGKINGRARADFYFGESRYAEVAARNLGRNYGKMFFLMPKQEAYLVR